MIGNAEEVEGKISVNLIGLSQLIKKVIYSIRKDDKNHLHVLKHSFSFNSNESLPMNALPLNTQIVRKKVFFLYVNLKK